MYLVSAIALGFIMDCILGDPVNIPHPVCFIGSFISKSEKVLRRIFPDTSKGKRTAGLFMAVITVLVTGIISYSIIFIANKINFWLGFAVNTVMCWQIFAAKCLKQEALKVMEKIKNEDLQGARYQISMLVGRDTQNLSFKQITKAAVETVAENTSDGVVAPLFWMIIGGPALGFCYKAINTMDSMVGYKNDKYIDFGRYPAKLDDLANYIPARICALSMILAAFVLKMDWKNSFYIWKRDKRKHSSPNSAQTESVCAGALKIQLAGNATYFGKLYEKPFIGDDIQPINYNHIKDSCNLMYGASIICLAVFSVIRILLF